MTRRVALLTLVCLLAATAIGAAQTPAPSSFNSNGVTIAYSDRGTGTPVVLMHGFTGTYARHFERSGVLSALEAAHYRTIAIDARGHGASGKPLDSRQYGLEQVRDVLRLMDHLRIPRAHIVGYSMGGAVATQLLVNHPDRVLTVTLIGSGWEDNLEQMTAMSMAMADGFDRRDASGLLGAVGTGGMSEAELAAATADLFARNDPKILATIARGMPELWRVSRQQLEATRIPVLAIAGTLDRNLEATKRMATVVRGLEVVVLEGATHSSSVRESVPHIVRFLNAQRTN